MKTTLAKKELVERKWFVIDAEGQILGRLAVRIANILRGRNKPTYTPHVDTGDYVVVINAEKVVLTGKKEQDKNYMSYSGWFGNERYRNVAAVREKHPEELIERAVKGMLPRNKLAAQVLGKLKVYAGPHHPHTAQEPEPLT
jgi:large subunit ribosomal protein L13